MPRVVRFHETGGEDVLRLDDLPTPDAAAGEVVIEVEAFGLNRAEIMFRKGDYPQYDPELPSALGYEAAGTVLAVGEGVDPWVVGDRVSTIPSFKMGRYWSYGEVARVPQHAVAPAPEELSSEEAASVWMPYMTAYGALLEYGRVTAGDVIVVNAASSSVGIAMIQMGAALGARVLALTRNPEKRAALEAHRPDHVIVTQEENPGDRILSLTNGEGAHYVFDPVAGPGLLELARATRYQGKLFVYGRLDPEPTPFSVNMGLAKGLTVRGYSIFEIVNFPERFARAKEHILAGVTRGDYRPVVDCVFPLERVVEAHRYMASNQQVGKIVVATR